MIELNHDCLSFAFPEVHPEARIEVQFQRTLRIPDNDSSHPLPPGLGAFPLRDVDNFVARVPQSWLERGGVMLPKYQSEAMWINLRAHRVRERLTEYPFAVKVATGGINAVTGQAWSGWLNQAPQDYMVAPVQPWLDGYCVDKGYIRQFVAMPLGAGYSVEEQLSGEAKDGGLQISVHPMKLKAFKKRFPRVWRWRKRESESLHCLCSPSAEMGLGAGGRMEQEVYEDPYELQDWDLTHSSRCCVHIANSLVWRRITAEQPPTKPPSADDYTRAGLPWFDYYDDSATALDGAERLRQVKSVSKIAAIQQGSTGVAESPVSPRLVFHLRAGLKAGQVREWTT